MATAIQSGPTFFDDCDDYSAEAARRFPFSAKHGRIRGTGKYVLISKCSVPWPILCFTTAAQRADTLDKWQRRSCGDTRCNFDHATEDL
jgi:hypothetical protein